MIRNDNDSEELEAPKITKKIHEQKSKLRIMQFVGEEVSIVAAAFRGNSSTDQNIGNVTGMEANWDVYEQCEYSTLRMNFCFASSVIIFCWHSTCSPCLSA